MRAQATVVSEKIESKWEWMLKTLWIEHTG